MNPVYSTEALRAISQSQNVTANNIANINTNEFKASRLDLETGPEGRGVRPAQIVEDATPGPPVPVQQVFENDQGRMEQREAVVEGSNTDLVREISQMILDERAFEANARTVRTHDRLAGNIIDILV